MPSAPLPLEAVICNDELDRRPSRAPDRAGERRGLQLLRQELAGTPRRVLQRLAEIALELCSAQSAGVSLLEQDGERRFFRWHAVAGAFAPLLWTTLPRELSPCGAVLECKAPLLMLSPERHFMPLLNISPKVEEVLLIPFAVRGELVGTVWVVSHDANRRFDREDLKLMRKLADFAAQAYTRLSSLSADDVLDLARMHKAGLRPAGLPPKSVQRRVLIVDDNPDAVESLVLLLRALGHEVRGSTSGRDALDIARTLRPDIAFVDVAMPGLSGYDVARELRRTLGPSVRIVAVTGFGDDEVRRRSVEAGFDHLVVKPVGEAFLKSLAG